jgi:enamine deaminase RidA (YjgF/YER057c/UK114 family)
LNREIRPDGLAPPASAYAHGVLSVGAARMVHTSGVVPVASDGTVPDGLADQADLVWENITTILAAAGMTTAEIVSVTTYVVAGNDLAVVMAARDRALDGHLAASTLVTVPELARSAWKVEIAVVAAA